MNITVFTIVYNNYGRFIPQWITHLKKQTIPPQIIIVLGKDHGADIQYLENNKIKYIYCDSTNMGTLRNKGIEAVKTDWWLYFSVDDELLPHVCKEIIDTKADAVSLTFDVINVDYTSIKNCESPMINTIDDLINWRQFRWGGYVAIKNREIRYKEDIEIPNILIHFELYKRGLKTVRSKTVSAVCHRWEKSHGLSVLNKKMSNDISKYIDKEVKKLTKDTIDKTDITVYTIAYNGYGRFLKEWISHVKDQQTPADKIVIVLGKKHGAKITQLKEQLKGTQHMIIKSESDTMGTLRNEAIDQIDTNWMLYFSADDILLPNAVAQIKRKALSSDAVVLKYIEQKQSGIMKTKYSALITMDTILQWKQTVIPGYIALKRSYKGKVMYYEDIEIPNYPYLFLIAYLDLKQTVTDEECAIYLHRKDSHGDRAKKSKKVNEFFKYIDNRAIYYFNLKAEPELRSAKIIKRKIMVMKTKQGFQDKETMHRYRPNKYIELPYNEERKIYLESNNLAEYIEAREEVVYNVSGKNNE